MKKFTLTLFYEGNVYNAYSFVDSVDLYSFVSLYRSICRANQLPLKGPEVVWFDFDFVSDAVCFDDTNLQDVIENALL